MILHSLHVLRLLELIEKHFWIAPKIFLNTPKKSGRVKITAIQKAILNAVLLAAPIVIKNLSGTMRFTRAPPKGGLASPAIARCKQPTPKIHLSNHHRVNVTKQRSSSMAKVGIFKIILDVILLAKLD